MDENKPLVPEVGMGVTYHCGSDCYPYTIVEVLSPSRIKVQEDKTLAWKPFPESEGTAFEPNPEAPVIVLSRRKGGIWERVGSPTTRGLGFVIGSRRAYRDPSF